MEDPCSSDATGSPGPLQGRSDGAHSGVGGAEACKLAAVHHEGLCVGVCDEELCSKAAAEFLSLRSSSGYPFQDGDEALDDAVYGGNGEPLLSKKAPDEWARSSDLANIVFGLKTEEEEEELFDNVDRFLCERDLFEAAGTKAAAPFAEADAASADAAGDANDADVTSEPAGPPLEAPEDPALSEVGQPLLAIPGPSGVRGRTFSCPVEDCDRVFERNRQLRVHLISHTAHRPFKCPVDGCDWAFATEYKLKRHLETHQGKKAFTCEVDGCGQSFTTVYNLRSHLKLHGRPTFECPGCGCSFGTRRKMELHLREHKELDAPYRCPEEGCGKAYYSSNTLASHLRVHQHRPEELRCPFADCGRQFGRACKLRLHMRQHTGERPYGCPECAWTFASASKLTRHMRKHTGDRRYTCPDCGKAFMRPEHLRGHMVVHSGGRPFACTEPGCSSRFAAKSSLYVHLKKHAQQGGERLVYACPVGSCARRFLSRGALCQHIERSHSLVVLDDGPSREEEEAAAVASVSSSRPSSPDLFTGLVQENQSGAARTDYAHHGHHRLLPGAVDVVLTSSATTPLQQEEAPGDLYAGLSVLAEHTDIGTTIRLQDFD